MLISLDECDVGLTLANPHLYDVPCAMQLDLDLTKTWVHFVFAVVDYAIFVLHSNRWDKSLLKRRASHTANVLEDDIFLCWSIDRK